VPEAKVLICPFRLGHDLLDHEGLKKMSHPFAPFKPVRRGIIRQGSSKAAVHDMNLRSFDQPMPGIPMPGRQPPNEEEPLKHDDIIVNGFPVQAESACDLAGIQELRRAQREKLEQSRQSAAVSDACDIADIAINQ